MSQTAIPVAHRVPSELLDQIAMEAFNDPDSVYDDKSVMAAFTSVSRRWARLCRPALWHSVCIWSEARHKALCTLLDSPPPPPLISVKNLIYEAEFIFSHADGTLPWLHRIHDALASRLPHTLEMFVSVDQHGTARTVRSLFPSLPRALPNIHFPLHNLILKDIRFESRSALLRLLAVAPQLRILSCKNLSWASDAPLAPSLAFSSSLNTVDLYGSAPLTADDVCWWLPPIVGHRSRPTLRDAQALRESCSLRDSDSAAVVSTMRCFLLKLRPLHVMVHRFGPSSDSDMMPRAWFTIMQDHDDAKEEMKVFICYTTPRGRSESNPADILVPSSSPAIIHNIQIEFPRPPLNDCWAPEDWEQSLAHWALLPDLEAVQLGFQHRSTMHDFMSKFRPVFHEMALPLAVSVQESGIGRWQWVYDPFGGGAEDQNMDILS